MISATEAQSLRTAEQDQAQEAGRIQGVIDEAICNDVDAVLQARRELKQAILQTIEEGDEGIPWGCFHPFSAVAQDSRERFADAVIQRLGS